MLIRRKKGWELPESEATPETVYLRRRALLKAMGLGSILVPGLMTAIAAQATEEDPSAGLYPFKRNPRYTLERPITDAKYSENYNNFYEFGTDKPDPAKNAPKWHVPDPWMVRIEGPAADKPQTLDLNAIMKIAPLEERIYRHRCVERWSMVIPWIGFPLSALLKRVEPTSKAKFVAFESVYDSKTMLNAQFAGIQFPYVEGLRMDEAMHPLTLLTFGLYGEMLPNQDGAPVRVVIPWKYGFKSAKSIVKIYFTSDQPPTAWNDSAPREYGFYSNVNPNVDHPRWSQKTERRIGASIFQQRQPTLMFNGYGDQVASLYAGMDLRKNF